MPAFPPPLQFSLPFPFRVAGLELVIARRNRWVATAMAS